MWKEVPRTRKKEVLSSHHVESSRPSLTTVSLEVLRSTYIEYSVGEFWTHVIHRYGHILQDAIGMNGYSLW